MSLAWGPGHINFLWLSDFRGHSLLNCSNCVGVLTCGVSCAESVNVSSWIHCCVVGVVELVSLASRSGHSVLGRTV